MAVCVLDGDRKWAKRLKQAIDYWVGRFFKMRRVNMQDPGWGREEDAHTEDAQNVNVDNHQRYMDREMEMGFPGGPEHIDDLESAEANVLLDSHAEALCYDKAMHFEELSLLYSRRQLACDPENGHK
eukprot:GHVR01128459.1.p1 GENE.GHVR01128459.1~~GHVR01128459.1.p1  ORF type:complete len:127 (+),score=29.00 GHVR01128459.1:428-808(+)